MPSALPLPLYAFGGVVAKLGFAGLTQAWLYTGARGYLAARLRDFIAHRRWMVPNLLVAEWLLKRDRIRASTQGLKPILLKITTQATVSHAAIICVLVNNTLVCMAAMFKRLCPIVSNKKIIVKA